MLKGETAPANANATHIDVPQGMHFESGPDRQPSGASDPVEGLNPRKDALEAIYAKRNQVLEQELEKHAVMLGETPPADAQGDAAAQQGHQPAQTATGEGDAAAAGANDGSAAPSAAAAEPAKGDAPDSAAATPAKQTFMVGNTPIELTQEEMVRAAEETLRRNREAHLIYGAQPQPNVSHAQPASQPFVRPTFNPNAAQPAPAQPAAPAPVINDSESQEFIQKLNYGSQEEQKQALTNLINTITQRTAAAPAQPGYTPEQIVQFAVNRALAQVQYNAMLQEVGSEFQDVFSDNLLSIAAGNLTGQLRQKYALLNQPKTEKELMREALTEVRTRYLAPRTPAQGDAGNLPANPAQQNSTVQAASPAASTQVVGDRIERKRATPQPPAAANKIASEASPVQQQTASDVVNWMRKTRHQPIHS